MEITIARESRTKAAEHSVVAVRDADGAWHVMRGVVPVAIAAAGQWQYDGAAADGAVEDAPAWLVDMLDDSAPEDWRMCRFEIRGITFSCPAAPTRDDSVLLSMMMASLDAEKTARLAVEEKLAQVTAPIDAKETADEKDEPEERGEQEAQPADGAGNSRGKRAARR